jgi:hypothetical protein
MNTTVLLPGPSGIISPCQSRSGYAFIFGTSPVPLQNTIPSGNYTYEWHSALNATLIVVKQGGGGSTLIWLHQQARGAHNRLALIINRNGGGGTQL